MECADTSKTIHAHYCKVVEAGGAIKYKSWQYKDVEVNVYNKEKVFKIETRRKRVIVECQTSNGEAVKEFVKAIDKLNTITALQKHLFVADWQNKRFEDCKPHIQHGDVLAVYNFAQNYTMMNQDAIKSDHYANVITNKMVN